MTVGNEEGSSRGRRRGGLREEFVCLSGMHEGYNPNAGRIIRWTRTPPASVIPTMSSPTTRHLTRSTRFQRSSSASAARNARTAKRERWLEDCQPESLENLRCDSGKSTPIAKPQTRKKMKPTTMAGTSEEVPIGGATCDGIIMTPSPATSIPTANHW
jgi:hypothetical protein